MVALKWVHENIIIIIGDTSETDIGNPSETNMPDPKPIGDDIEDVVCRSPMGLRSSMLVSDGSPIMHVGLW